MELIRPGKISHWRSLYRLYREAFPASERKPVAMILRSYRSGKSDIWCAVENGRFAGMAITINSSETVLLDYLAVCKKSRNNGIGSAILQRLQQRYAGKGVFIEIENPYADCPDHTLRQRRKAFYLRNGFAPMGVMVYLFGVEMELLGINCRLSYAQYHSFYRDNYNHWAAEHITESVYPQL